MADPDLFRNFRRGVAAPSGEAHRRASVRLARAFDETAGTPRVTRVRHNRRRLVVLAAATLVLVVVAASAFGAARAIFAHQPHVEKAFYAIEGKRGSFTIRMFHVSNTERSRTRSWRIVPEPGRDAAVSVPATGQYVQVTGAGGVAQTGGRAQAWSARLVGFVTRPGEVKQRIAITMKGRPTGVFVLTPLEPGVLKHDSGTQSHTATAG